MFLALITAAALLFASLLFYSLAGSAILHVVVRLILSRGGLCASEDKA